MSQGIPSTGDSVDNPLWEINVGCKKDSKEGAIGRSLYTVCHIGDNLRGTEAPAKPGENVVFYRRARQALSYRGYTLLSEATMQLVAWVRGHLGNTLLVCLGHSSSMG